MALWKRFKRMVKANVGRFVSDDAPGSRSGDKKLDEDVATLRGHATFLERKLTKLRTKEAELEAKVQAAEAHGPLAASNYEIELQSVRIELAGVEAQLTQARGALEKAEMVRASIIEARAAVAAPPPAVDDDPSPPRIKVSARGGTSSSSASGRKTIGPEAAQLPSERPGVESVPGPPAAKTLGPAPESAPAPKTVGPPPGPEAEPLTETAEASPAAGKDVVAELERLGRLREAGALTEEEFDVAKQKLLAEM